MKLRNINFIILLFSCSLFGNTANASLAYNSTLLMGEQSSHCLNNLGTPGSCTDYEVPDRNYWVFDVSADRVFSEDERISIEAGADGGIVLGATQGIGDIDANWIFIGATGYHYTRTPITIISDDNSGNVVLDMSGLSIWWNDDFISLDFYKDVVGILTCGNACENGDSFVLEARSMIPASCFGGSCPYREDYLFHIEGTISSVPVPGAVWLLGSGLIGLFSVARRKQFE